MRWIKLSDRMPDIEIDGNKILIYRVVNINQEALAISIYDTRMINFCDPDETWWMSLPALPYY